MVCKTVPFLRKKTFSWFESKVSKTTSSLGEFNLHLPFWIIQVPFCQTKVPFYWSKEPFDWIELNLIEFSILFKQFFNFDLFHLKYFYKCFTEAYAIYKIVDHGNKKLNRNAHNAMRKSLLWNTCWLQIKNFTQTSAFSCFCGLNDFNFL